MPTSSSAVTGLFRPTPVSQQDYSRYSQNEPTTTTTTNNDLTQLPEIPSTAAKGILSSTAVRVGLGALAFLAVATAVGVPLGIILTATTTSGTTTTTVRGTTASTLSTTSATSTTSTTATTVSTTVTTATTATTTSVTTVTTATTTTTSVTTTTTTATTVSTTTMTTTTTITAAFTVSGPQLNFNVSTLTSAWSLCYSALYSEPLFPNISSILSSCWKSKLLLGCRPVSNTLLTLAAMGNRADVLFNTSASSSLTQQANGVGWYFTMNTASWNSWGFVLGSNSAVRGNCDGDMSTNPAYRLCWHLIGTAGGWRCGATGSLDTSTSWMKVIYHAM